jgi:glucokinase
MPDHVVAIDVGGTYLKAASVDRRGQVLTARHEPTGAGRGPEAVIAAVLALASELSPSPAAVGLAVPGVVDDRAGRVVDAVNLGWRDVAIGEVASRRLGVPVAVLHDVRASARAEGLRGAARGCRDYLLITLGTGVGAAVVIGGRPYTGAHGFGGELGHVTVDPRGPVCGCGRPGCLEALASAGYVGRRAGGLRAEQVAARAWAGDGEASLVWGDALDALALAISNYLILLDPELVVIGGGMASAGAPLFDGVRERVADLLPFGEACPIVPAELGDEAGCHGAAIAAWEAAEA